MKVASLLNEILRREGGYTDHPADRGGPTNFGITLATLSEYEGRPVQAGDVKALDKKKAGEIYKKLYFEPFKFVADENLAALLVDSAVQHGVQRAMKWLQEGLGVEADGIAGPVTKGAYRQAEPSVVYRVVLRRRIVFYGQIIKNDPKQAVFAEGWMRRVAEFV